MSVSHYESVAQRAAVHESGRMVAAWVLRCLAVAVLFVVAAQWSANPMWSGDTKCPVTEGMCELSTVEAHAPASLWVLTALATLAVCVVAALVGPRAFRPRVIWAVVVGASVFVAHRNNALWAIAVTALGVYGIASTTDDFPPHEHQTDE